MKSRPCFMFELCAVTFPPEEQSNTLPWYGSNAKIIIFSDYVRSQFMYLSFYIHHACKVAVKNWTHFQVKSHLLSYAQVWCDTGEMKSLLAAAIQAHIGLLQCIKYTFYINDMNSTRQ